MSRRAAGSDGAGGVGGVGKSAVAALAVVGTALVLLLIVRARPGPEPFDPRSSTASGATALVELLERSGGDVDITRTPPVPGDSTRLLVLVDQLDDEQRSATLDFVEAGGVAVVADPSSTLHGGPQLDGGSTVVASRDLPDRRLPVDVESTVDPGMCNIGAFEGVRGIYIPDGLRYPVGPNEPQCFADGGRSFVIVRPIGAGLVVGLGDNEVFVNEHLRRADNAALAVAMLAPPASANTTIVLGRGTAASIADVGEGDDTLIDLVPQWVWTALIVGSLAFVIFAVSRSVRVGVVLDEPLATPIAGSELVAATGNLMQRAKHTTKAAWLLQSQLHRDLCRELRVAVTAPLVDLDQAAVARFGVEPGAVERTLRDTVVDDTQLLALSAHIERIRKDVLT